MSELQKNPGSGNTDSIDAFLGELIQSIKAKETVVFCGAGISRNSGLPIVSELVPYILAKLGVTAEETQTIMNANLPFEAFMETLRENSDVGRIFDIFDLGEPNTNHLLLAKLAKAGYITTICTTNFDCLIEKAFDREGLARGKDYQVYYKEADLKRIQWNDNAVRLIKIHGSVEDRENMAITLGQVASQTLSSQRYGVIEHIFSVGPHRQVLIMGYSCSDVFDISPQIEAIGKNKKKVMFIDHHEEKSEVKDLAEKEKKNPFRHFGGSSWIKFDTDKLVEVIWNSCIAEKIPSQPAIDKAVWGKFVEAWYSEAEKKRGEGSKYNIAGQIFYKISEFQHAIKCFEEALRFAREIDYKLLEGISLGNLGNAYDGLGEYKKAIDYFERALSIIKEAGGGKQEEGSILGNLGSTYERLGEYRKTIYYSEQALYITRQIDDKRGEGSRLGNAGVAYSSLGEYRKAIGYYEQALLIARETGDKHAEGSWLGSLGNAYHSLGEYQRAIDYHKQALSIAKQIGEKRHEGIWLDNMGTTYLSLGEYREAISYYEQALSIARQISAEGLEESCLGLLGNSYYGLGEYREAIGYYEQALLIAREIGNKQGEGGWLGGLGNTYHSLGEYQRAIDYHKQALSITRQIGDKRNEGILLGNLGNNYNKLDEYWKAIDCYEQALSIARQIDDKHGEGSRLGNIGATYGNLGEYQKAIGYYEQSLSILKPMLGDGHPQVKLSVECLNIAMKWSGNFGQSS